MDDLDQLEEFDDVDIVYLDQDLIESDEETVEPEQQQQAEVIDLSVATFSGHTKAVFCTSLTRDGSLAVSGGEDDSAFVWSTRTGQVVFQCTGHQESVICVGFNQSDTLLASADMGGVVQVWRLSDGGSLVWRYETDEVEWLLWHGQADNVLFSGTQTGDVYLWQIPDGLCKILPSHGAASTSAHLLSDGKRILVGYADGVLKLWDIRLASAIWSHSQESGVTAVEVNADDSLLCAAPASKLLKVADAKSLGNLLLEHETEIETCIFHETLLITGAISGQVCVWDLARQAVRHQEKIEAAVTVLKMVPNSQKVLIGSADGNVYICDVRNGTLLATLTGHTSDVLSISTFQDGQRLLTSADDGTCKIFTIPV